MKSRDTSHTRLGDEVGSAGKDKGRGEEVGRGQDLEKVSFAEHGEGDGAELMEEGHLWEGGWGIVVEADEDDGGGVVACVCEEAEEVAGEEEEGEEGGKGGGEECELEGVGHKVGRGGPNNSCR